MARALIGVKNNSKPNKKTKKPYIAMGGKKNKPVSNQQNHGS
jgi:hypothetical protein